MLIKNSGESRSKCSFEKVSKKKNVSIHCLGLVLKKGIGLQKTTINKKKNGRRKIIFYDNYKYLYIVDNNLTKKFSTIWFWTYVFLNTSLLCHVFRYHDAFQWQSQLKCFVKQKPKPLKTVKNRPPPWLRTTIDRFEWKL